MEKDTIIIWYDSNTNEFQISAENNLLSDEELNSCCTLFNDLNSCIDYIKSFPKDSIYFITTVTCAYYILPLIHEMRQIDSVFLVTEDHKNFDRLLINYSKIIACFRDKQTLTESLKNSIELAQKQKLTFSFYNQHKKPSRELSKESALFLWFQLFKNVLLNMPSNDNNAKEDLIEFLKQRYWNNNKQLKLIEEFQITYKQDDVIRWYTGQPFLYRQLNKALRTEDLDQLYTFRFFISDLCKRLQHEFQILKEYEPKVTLYRGASISIDEYQKLKKNEGNLISMNGFLSTSLSKDVALAFMGITNETKQAVLFEIECDLSQVETIVLAHIVEYSAIESEEEVLVDIGAVFQILSIEPQDSMVLIKMIATDEGTKICENYITINQAELKEKNVRIVWGDLLLGMGHQEKALQYFQKLQTLDNTTKDWQLQIHIGHVLSHMGLYKDALEKYLYAKELWDKQESTINISIYSHLSSLFIIMGLYDMPLPMLSRALQVYESFPIMEHDKIFYHDIASFLSAMGLCYFYKGDYDLAITYLNRAYDIRETHYLEDHFLSADDLHFLAKIYHSKGNYKRALHLFSHATSIYERTLPADHPKMIDQLVNIGLTYRDLKEKEVALKYLKHALVLHTNTSSDLPLEIAYSLEVSAEIFFLEGDEQNTSKCIQELLERKRSYLLQDHPDIANYLTCLGNILQDQKQYDEAMVNYKKALLIYETINPNGHPQAAIVMHGIGFIYRVNGEYETALSYIKRLN